MEEKFSYDEFILKLKELGFIVKVEPIRDRDFTFKLEVNNLNISGADYPLFGRYFGGAYNPCGFSKKTEFSYSDLEKAVKHCSILLMNEIERVSKTPNYYTCKEYLNKNFGKTNIEKIAIDRVFKILKENYNDIIRTS